MKLLSRIIIPLLFVFQIACQQTTKQESRSLKPAYFFVDPLIGTAISTTETAKLHSEAGSELRGQNFPAVSSPFAMTNWTPQTNASEQKCLPPYYYEAQTLQGFRGSHWMSGSCTQDYGSFTIMPMIGALKISPDERASSFSHESEMAEPAYYSVDLQDYHIKAELTGLTYSSIMNFTFQDDTVAYLVVEPNSDEGEGFIKINPEEKQIVGYNPAHRIYQGWGESAGFSGYFVVQLEKEFEEAGTWTDTETAANVLEAQGKGKQVGGYLKFPVSAGETVTIRMGTSFTSIEDARKNLESEIKSSDFQTVQEKAETIWNIALEKIKVQGGSEDDKVVFYSALYHSMLLPRQFDNADGTYPAFAGKDSIYKADGFHYYDDYSMWDTYRSVHPLHTIINQEKTLAMVKSLIAKGEQGGWLPIFPAWNNYTSAMIGDHAIAMIGDAWMKGIDDFDQEKAYALMRKNAFQPNTDLKDYRSGKGRRALDSYLKYHYIPLEDTVPDSFHKKEQVSRTLEYAYDDFVLSQVAKKLNKQSDYDSLIDRAKNYQHVIDSTIGFARGKYADGSWIKPFDPVASRASFITEGSPFQYTWYVPQDVAGLMQWMGGKEKFVHRLDSLFENRFYWHGNEPGHQTVYLYNYAGAPWKTQAQVRQIMKEEYGVGPGGLSGNEDAGQMSAWMVFSMVGFYPVCPGMPYYVLGSPAFEEIIFQVSETDNFIIRAENNSEKNIYIQSATLNGNPIDRSFITHKEIMEGGELLLKMDSVPNKTWATQQEPPSLGEVD